jgi:electron transfer flavoprotein alpha subunit
MSANVLVLAEHEDKQISDGTYELVGAARELAVAMGGATEVALLGPRDLAAQLGGADVVVSVDHPALARYLPEAYEQALLAVLAERSPRLVLMSMATPGLDLGAALAVRWQAPLATGVMGLEATDGVVVATAQMLGGKVLAELELPGERAIAAVIGGAFPAAGGQPDRAPEVIEMAPPAALDDLAMSLLGVSEPPVGDVDITTADLLVSVGRGIESQDNVELVQELGDALGVPLAASRPVVDAGWLPKTRQVGKSGLKVKPKAYLAFGISGAPEHLEGMRGADLIIACNTDPGAPIFEVAHYGTTVDLFDLVPALAEKLSQ